MGPRLPATVEPGKNSRRIVGNRFVKFWLDDLPPFSGKMRAVFYGGLLVLALTQTSPITLASPLAGSDPALHNPVEFVRWSGLGSLDGNAILFLRNLCLASWACAAAGLFTGPAKLATALTLLPLHALSIGIHNSHGWYVPAYTLLFLCLARSDRDFSLDALIRQKWPGWMGGNLRQGIGTSGLPRKLVLLVAVHTLFAGGVSKLREGGWQWIDGHSLQSYISLTWECLGTSPRFPLIADAILHSQTIAIACSAAALVLELAAPIALFSRKARTALLGKTLMWKASMPKFAWNCWIASSSSTCAKSMRRPAITPTNTTSNDRTAAWEKDPLPSRRSANFRSGLRPALQFALVMSP
jgi:hypothetical protein